MTDDEITYAEWKVLEVEDNPHVTNLLPNQREIITGEMCLV